MTFIKIKKLALLVVITVIFSIPFYHALSTSVPGTIAIQLGEDESINCATRTLQNNLPGISIIKYDSFKYHLISHRVLQPIIWIGHGNQEGIIANNELMKWTQFSEKIMQSRSLDIILSCYSSQIIQQTTLTRNDVITFNNNIDSILGSLFIAYALTGSQSILSQAGNHYLSLLKKETPYRPLRMDPGDGGGGGGSNPPPTTPNIPSSFQAAESSHSYVIFNLSGNELAFWILMLIVLALNLIVGIPVSYADWSFITKAAVMFYVVGKISLITALAFYAGGMMTEASLIENIFASFHQIFGCLAAAIIAATVLEKVLFIAMLVLAGILISLELLLDALSGSGTAIRVAIALAMIAVYLIGFSLDASDTDTVVG